MEVEPEIIEEQEKGEKKVEQPPNSEMDQQPNQSQKFVDEVRIGDETIFTIPPEMQY